MFIFENMIDSVAHPLDHEFLKTVQYFLLQFVHYFIIVIVNFISL